MDADDLAFHHATYADESAALNIADVQPEQITNTLEVDSADKVSDCDDLDTRCAANKYVVCLDTLGHCSDTVFRVVTCLYHLYDRTCISYLPNIPCFRSHHKFPLGHCSQTMSRRARQGRQRASPRPTPGIIVGDAAMLEAEQPQDPGFDESQSTPKPHTPQPLPTSCAPAPPDFSAHLDPLPTTDSSDPVMDADWWLSGRWTSVAYELYGYEVIDPASGSLGHPSKRFLAYAAIAAEHHIAHRKSRSPVVAVHPRRGDETSTSRRSREHRNMRQVRFLLDTQFVSVIELGANHPHQQTKGVATALPHQISGLTQSFNSVHIREPTPELPSSSDPPASGG